MNRIGRLRAISTSAVMALALVSPFAQTPSTNNQQTDKQERHAFGRHHKRGGKMFGRLGQQLNLTDAQKAQMKQIGQSYRERTKALREQLQAKRQELREANQGGVFNEALATQKLTESAAIRAKLMGEQFRMRQEMMAVLTPEQKTQLDQLRQEFKNKREQFKSKRAERGVQQG
ncbi:MAG TPA: Spy/CpxP family protein refolding chaperone [Blastocatellia bacterium]|nr:Spy/CpxP family protein refolding chaperone [Blastocatellia bacterium]